MGNRQRAVELYNQGVSAINDLNNPDRFNHGYRLFANACLADPTWGEAHYQLGNNNHDLNWPLASIAHWRQALNCETDITLRAKILSNLAWKLHDLGEVTEALECAQASAELDGSLDMVWVNLSVIHRTLGHLQTSVQCAQRAFELAPQTAMNEFALGMAYAFNRQWKLGFKHLESRFAYRLKNYLQYPYPKWIGEEGKHVYVLADQGLGDTLSFSRFLPAACARSKHVHALVQPELLHLFQRAFGHIDNLTLFATSNQFPPAECWTTFVSLPSALELSGKEIEDAPHFQVDRYDIPVNWRIPDRRFHVGVCWAGSALNDIDKHRSFSVTEFLELYKVSGIQLYGLQKSKDNAQLYENGCLALIWDLTPNIFTVIDTIALIRRLDLVITCESALAHICALAGVECWIPYSYLGLDYRIGVTGEHQLWSNHRVFRQGPDRRWKPVFEQISEALRERLDAQHRGNVGARILERA